MSFGEGSRSLILIAAGAVAHGRQLGMWSLAGIVLVLLFALGALSSNRQRRSLRFPLLLMFSWAVTTILWWMPFVTTGLREWCEIVAKVSLALAGVRTGWIVVVEWALNDGSALGISRISRDLVQAALFLIASIAAAREAGADARALATTGGLVTAGLTFSLQQTLGDLVAGLLLQAEAPFKVDDWIAYDENPAHIGRVVEINWRATKIITDDLVILAVPNSALSKATIVNFHEPSPPARRTVRVTVSYDTPPEQMFAVAVDAARQVEGVISEPGPNCIVEEFADSGVTYALRFFIRDQPARVRIESGVRTRLWYALKRAGIEIVFPRTDVSLRDAKTESDATMARERVAREEMFTHVEFFRVLPRDERVKLAERARTILFATGETVVRQGDTGTEMYLLAHGELGVFTDGGKKEIARVPVGGFFGEMALLTGEPRSATVRAVKPCTVHVIDKPVMQSLFDAHPQMLGVVSEAVAARQDEIARSRGEQLGSSADITSRHRGLMTRMKLFFGGESADDDAE